jgi:hypothetical protein
LIVLRFATVGLSLDFEQPHVEYGKARTRPMTTTRAAMKT